MPGERTEQASPHRREKARQDGDILHSRELSAAAGTLAGVMTLGAVAGKAVEAWRSGFAAFLDLGVPAHWENAELEPTLLAMRRISIAFFSPLGMVMVSIAERGGVAPGSAGHDVATFVVHGYSPGDPLPLFWKEIPYFK